MAQQDGKGRQFLLARARPGVEADTRTAAKLLDPGVLPQRAS